MVFGEDVDGTEIEQCVVADREPLPAQRTYDRGDDRHDRDTDDERTNPSAGAAGIV